MAAPVLPHETTHVAALLQLVTVQPDGGQLTTHPPAGHATSQLADVWHETVQLVELRQSMSQLGAPLHATLQDEPPSQVRAQSSSAVQTHVFGLLQMSSEPQPAAARARSTSSASEDESDESENDENSEATYFFMSNLLGRRG